MNILKTVIALIATQLQIILVVALIYAIVKTKGTGFKILCILLIWSVFMGMLGMWM